MGRMGTRGRLVGVSAVAAAVTLTASWSATAAAAVSRGPAVAAGAGVRAATWFSGFDAKPEPVRKGGTIKVSGVLKGRQGATFPLSNKTVNIYFRPADGGSWVEVGSDRTDDRGRFAESFRAKRDGSFKAVYPGSILYKKSTSRADAVDVR